jgi:hypothetical protein
VFSAPVRVGGEYIATYIIYHDISALQRQKQYFASVLQASPPRSSRSTSRTT